MKKKKWWETTEALALGLGSVLVMLGLILVLMWPSLHQFIGFMVHGF
jgi:hypothetical protein